MLSLKCWRLADPGPMQNGFPRALGGLGTWRLCFRQGHPKFFPPSTVAIQGFRSAPHPVNTLAVRAGVTTLPGEYSQFCGLCGCSCASDHSTPSPSPEGFKDVKLPH